jgi:hypothetical protein
MRNNAATVMNGTRRPGDVRGAELFELASIKGDFPLS